MRFVSGPCSDTQPSRATSDSGREKDARAVIQAGGRYPVHRATVPARAAVRCEGKTAWTMPPARSGVRSLPLTQSGLGARPNRAVCAVSRWTSRRRLDYCWTMDAPRIPPKPSGPLIVEGPVKIVTPDGRELPVPPRKDGRPAEVIVLCRCGGSATKPFCDGSHKRNGFSDAPPAGLAPTI